MSKLREILLGNETWLTKRVLRYAKKYHYTDYTSTLLEAWRMSIQGLSASIAEGHKRFGFNIQLGPHVTSDTNPITRFGIFEAQQHRRRGVSLSMFLGAMKCYRQSYLDLLTDQAHLLVIEEQCKRFLDRCFDLIEIAFCEEWANTGPENRLQELQETNRTLTNEKNTYLTVFESLAEPAILLNSDSIITNLNHSAACLVRPDFNPGEVYYSGSSLPANQAVQENHEKASLPEMLIGKKVHDVFPWLPDSLEKSGLGTPGKCERKTVIQGRIRYFEIIRSEMLDVSHRISGALLVLRDITGQTEAEQELEAHRRHLEEMIVQRTAELTRINDRLRLEAEERQKGEASLRDSEYQLNNILNAIPDYVMILNEDLVITWCNQPFKDLIRKDLTGIRCHQVLHNDDHPCAVCLVKKTFETGQAQENESDVVDFQGQERTFWRTTAVIRRDPAGRPVLVMEITRDVTKRKQDERELNENQKFVQNVAEASPDILCIFDIEDRVPVYTNQNVFNHLGYRPEEIKEMGKGFIPIVLHPDDLAGLDQTFTRWDTAKDDEVFVGEYRLKNKVGDWHWYQSREKVFLRDDRGKVRHFIGIFQDVTESKNTEQKLYDYQRQLKELAMELSLAEERERHHLMEKLHDGIGQQLYAIKMMLASLQSGTGSEAHKSLYDQVMNMIDTTIDDARTLMFELCPPILYELGLVSAIDWLINQQTQPSTLTYKHESTVQTDHLHDQVRGLAFRAVRELLLNVKKHAEAHSVKVSTTHQGDYLTIAVQDDGKGFDPNSLPWHEGQNRGFGLFNIKERIEQLGGILEVNSNTDMGTKVNLYIPQEPLLKKGKTENG